MTSSNDSSAAGTKRTALSSPNVVMFMHLIRLLVISKNKINFSGDSPESYVRGVCVCVTATVILSNMESLLQNVWDTENKQRLKVIRQIRSSSKQHSKLARRHHFSKRHNFYSFLIANDTIMLFNAAAMQPVGYVMYVREIPRQINVQSILVGAWMLYTVGCSLRLESFLASIVSPHCKSFPHSSINILICGKFSSLFIYLISEIRCNLYELREIQPGYFCVVNAHVCVCNRAAYIYHSVLLV